MDTLIVSDAHVDDPDAAADLGAFLRAHDARVTVLLGDVCDGWWDYRDGPRAQHRPLVEAIAAMTARGRRVVWVRGNRDFAHPSYPTAGYEVTDLWRDGDLVGFHGHDRCGLRDAWLSAALRRLSQHTRSLPDRWVQRLVDGAGAASRARPAHTARLLETTEAEVRRVLRRGARVVFSGHTHTPFVRRLPEGWWVNTGAWHGLRTWVSCEADTVTLWDERGPIASADRSAEPGAVEQLGVVEHALAAEHDAQLGALGEQRR